MCAESKMAVLLVNMWCNIPRKSIIQSLKVKSHKWLLKQTTNGTWLRLHKCMFLNFWTLTGRNLYWSHYSTAPMNGMAWGPPCWKIDIVVGYALGWNERQRSINPRGATPNIGTWTFIWYMSVHTIQTILQCPCPKLIWCLPHINKIVSCCDFSPAQRHVRRAYTAIGRTLTKCRPTQSIYADNLSLQGKIRENREFCEKKSPQGKIREFGKMGKIREFYKNMSGKYQGIFSLYVKLCNLLNMVNKW